MDKFIGKWAFPLDDSLLEQSARRGEVYDFAKIAEDIMDKVHFESEDVVLDLCCGNAALAKIISKNCKEIHGVDHSERLIKSAQKITADISRLGSPPLGLPEVASEALEGVVQLHLSDAMNIDGLFKENCFDVSYCYFSFQYFNKRKRELLLEKISRVTKQNGSIFLGDIPEKTRRWNFYKSPLRFYKEKISRMLQFKEGECDLGWWIDPNEIAEWCDKRGLSASVLSQKANMPHAHYRFDVLIRNSKS